MTYLSQVIKRKMVSIHCRPMAAKLEDGSDEEGKPIMIDKLMKHKWSGEE